MIKADARSDRLLRLGRIVPCIDACETIEAGVVARDRAALMLRGPVKAPTNVTPETSQR
jgi:hypothetical protein